jgi:hypothetical protein
VAFALLYDRGSDWFVDFYSGEGLGRMRNALKIIVVSGVLTVVCLEKAKAADIPPPSVYATPVTSSNVVPQEGDSGLLRVRTSNLPPITYPDQTGNSASTPAVEAIPTPTAFNAGVFLLLVIFLGRCFRKIRWA